MSIANNYVVIPPEEISKYSDKERISSHCMIYAKLPGVIQIGGENCTPHGAVLMQLRFDGKLGFAGGLVDGNESPVDGVNREMNEEINLDLSLHKVKSEDHVVTLYNKKTDAIHHFYAMQVSESEFKAIERRSLEAHDYGDEVMGILRAPLYTRADGLSGFPTFLTHAFAGCSYQQLLAGLKTTKLLSNDQIEQAENIADKIRKST